MQQNNKQNLILVVDDNSNNLKVLAEVLRAAGHRVLVANSGESALEKLKQISPNLILLDVMMPGIDGFETCRRLKALETTRDIPVIFTTALSDAIDRVKGLELGAVDYITKPIQHDEVLARVNVHLKLYNLTQELEQRVAERTTALQTALDRVQESQIQLVQSEKLSALGQMMAGVAHEINNPISFIAGNLTPAKDYIKNLFELIDLYQKKLPHPDAEIEAEIAAIDLEYLREDLPKLINSMELGVDRICSISNSLRNFSRSDLNYKVPWDIHEGIDSTILILQHRLKANDDRPTIEVVKEYGNLPAIECFPGQLNQVFMNILANAIDALEESNQGRSFAEIKLNPNRITIRTEMKLNECLTIRIADNGIGMSEALKAKIFDHLFTTKGVGKGTGLGLAIARQIVVEKHGGSIDVTSCPGMGTEFKIVLPISAE